MTDDEAQIRALVARYLEAYESRDAAGCAAVFAVDAVVLSPWGPPVRGRNAIARAHEEWFEADERDKVMTIVDMGHAGDIGFCLLRYEAEVPAEGGGRDKVHGAGLNVVTRQEGGAWKIQHTSLNETEDGSWR